MLCDVLSAYLTVVALILLTYTTLWYGKTSFLVSPSPSEFSCRIVSMTSLSRAHSEVFAHIQALECQCLFWLRSIKCLLSHRFSPEGIFQEGDFSALSTCLVTSILFQFIYLFTHQPSTLVLPSSGKSKKQDGLSSVHGRRQSLCPWVLHYSDWPLSLKPSLLHDMPPRTLAECGVFIYLFIYFCLFMAAPEACGSSQARGRIGSVAAGLHHSHSNTGSEPCLWPTSQFTAMLDP